MSIHSYVRKRARMQVYIYMQCAMSLTATKKRDAGEQENDMR